MKYTILLTLGLLPAFIFCQKKIQQGTIIPAFGDTYTVPTPTYETNTQHPLKAVFDISHSSNDSTAINPLLNTAARYLNMHTAAGIPIEKLKVALVIHGNASNDLLTSQKYKAKFGIENPNTPLLKALLQHQVQIILCGQTAAYRNITKLDMHEGVLLALSAMTALVQLQNNDYRLINF